MHTCWQMSTFVNNNIILPRVSDLWELQNIMAVVSVGWKSSQGCVVMKKINPSNAHCRMTTGTYLSKINTVTFSYGYFQKKTKKNMHFGKKKNHAGKSFECNLKLN